PGAADRQPGALGRERRVDGARGRRRPVPGDRTGRRALRPQPPDRTRGPLGQPGRSRAARALAEPGDEPGGCPGAERRSRPRAGGRQGVSIFRLDGKTALVTGASQGIGAAVAALLARQGARVVLAARNVERLTAVVGEIEAVGGQAVALALDVAA